MWQLDFHRSDDYPRLAWCAVATKRDPTIVVHHGPWIEVSDSAFVEGAWSGPYAGLDFAAASTFVGSGGLLALRGLLLATATHTSECLYVLRTGETTICSNSLPFLLTIAGDDIDLEYPYYDVDIMSIGLGLKRYRSAIPTRSHNKVHLLYYCNALLGPELTITRLPKRRPGPFPIYSVYRDFLQREVEATIQNAADQRRSITYTPITTISMGYDSTAAAALASMAGCREAVTCVTAHDETGADSYDSGKQIGELLGLAVTEYDPRAYLTRTGLPEAEFLATGAGGGDVVLTLLETALARRLLLTGYHGDPAWDRVNNTGGPDMMRLDPSPGSDMIYFRTRLGCLHLPVPSIGYIEHDSILALSNSPEMQPWSLDQEDYDRPIPRRIVEEAGVPRELFGQRKKIVARAYKYTDLHTVLEDPDLQGIMAPESYADFRAWAQMKLPFRGPLDRLVFGGMHRLYRWNIRVIYSRKVHGVANRLHIHLPRAPWISSKYSRRQTMHRLLFHWGMKRIMPRYAAKSYPVAARRLW